MPVRLCDKDGCDGKCQQVSVDGWLCYKCGLEGRGRRMPVTAVWDAVIEDMRARDRLGAERYGTRLQPHNGRDSIRDAYEEALDMAVYLKQFLMERG